MASAPANQCEKVMASSGSVMIQYKDEDPAVTRFRELLSIRTVSLKSLDTPGLQPDYCKYLVRFVQARCKVPGAGLI